MVIHAQPDKETMLNLRPKVPGPTLAPGSIAMCARGQDCFEALGTTGRGTLLRAAMTGNATLSRRTDAAEAGRAVGQPIPDVRQAGRVEALPRVAGPGGAAAADKPPERGGRRRHRLAP